MASKNEAFRSGIIFGGPFNQKRQFESRALPGNPHDLATELFIELFQLPFSVRARRQSDRPVWVQMIDMIEREKCMQGSIDGCSYAILAKRRKRIVADHLIFKLFPAVQLLQLFQTIEVEQRKSAFGDGAEISATSLYRQNSHWPPRERIRKI